MSHPVDSPEAIRLGTRDLLSLALIDSRNRTLELLGAIEQALHSSIATPPSLPSPPPADPPLWTVGHIGWFAEYWIGRNTQRALGSRCPREPTRIASVEPEADTFWNPAQLDAARRWQVFLPDAQAVRAYLLETLESTLALLEKTPDEDEPLYFFRAALAREDACGERLIVDCQTLGLALPLHAPAGLQRREPLVCAATRWRLGSERGGYVPAVEQWAHEVAVPEFEIDAQPVTWAQFVEFVDDGGYDREELWHGEGRAWLQAEAQRAERRAPRHVEQIGAARLGGSATVQSWFGRAQRMAGSQPVVHASWFEADAWARWAGRRLPSEVEWEIAAQLAARRGFRWAEVHEWTANPLRPWPGYCAGPLAAQLEPLFGRARVLRGASWATHRRLVHPKARRWALPERDEGFFGFRTCAI